MIIVSFVLIILFLIFLTPNKKENITSPDIIKTNYIDHTNPFKIQLSYPSFLINKSYKGDTIVDANGKEIILIKQEEKELLNNLKEYLKNQQIDFKTPNNKNELEVVTHNNNHIEETVIIPISSTLFSFLGETNGKKIDISYDKGDIFIRNGEIIMKYVAV